MCLVQSLTERLTQYHPARSLSKITEVMSRHLPGGQPSNMMQVTEQILEEHESELVSAFVAGKPQCSVCSG